MPLYMQDETIDHAIKIYKNFYKDFNVGFAKSQSEIYFGSISSYIYLNQEQNRHIQRWGLNRYSYLSSSLYLAFDIHLRQSIYPLLC